MMYILTQFNKNKEFLNFGEKNSDDQDWASSHETTLDILFAIQLISVLISTLALSLTIYNYVKYIRKIQEDKLKH